MPISCDPRTLSPLITEAALQQRITAMAQTINQTYTETDPLILIGILKGSFMFLADLVRGLDVPCHVEFVRLASYGAHRASSGTVKPVDLSLPNLADKDVLIVEDIVDSGRTLSFFMNYVQQLHQTRSLRLAVLLDKPGARHASAAEIKPDFCGFAVADDAFVVGYGLDYAEYYRNLPYIAELPPEAQPPKRSTP